MFCAPCPDRTREAPSPKLTSRTWRSAGSWFGWGVGCVVFEGVPGQGFESWSLVVGAIDGASGQEHDTGQGQECFGTDLVWGVHGMWTGILGWIRRVLIEGRCAAVGGNTAGRAVRGTDVVPDRRTDPGRGRPGSGRPGRAGAGCRGEGDEPRWCSGFQ